MHFIRLEAISANTKGWCPTAWYVRIIIQDTEFCFVCLRDQLWFINFSFVFLTVFTFGKQHPTVPNVKLKTLNICWVKYAKKNNFIRQLLYDKTMHYPIIPSLFTMESTIKIFIKFWYKLNLEVVLDPHPQRIHKIFSWKKKMFYVGSHRDKTLGFRD